MSAPLVPLVLLWIIALLLGERQPLSWLTWLGLAALSLVIGLVVIRRQDARANRDLPLLFHPPVYGTLLALAFTLGAARGAAHRPAFTATDLAIYNDTGRVTVLGTVARYPEPRGRFTLYEVAARELVLAGSGTRLTVKGRLLVNLPPYPTYQYGDALKLTGELVTPPILDTFDYRAYLAHKGIFSLLEEARGSAVAHGYGSRLFHALFALRQRAERTITLLLPEPHASLLNGILLGIESDIPEEVLEDFSTTGATHVLVISGANFAILAAIFLLIGRRFLGERWGSLLAILMILLYALLVGGEPPVLRAAFMGLLGVWALLVRRTTVALNTLAFAVLVMTACQPGQLYDVGFQLSTMATLGLIVLVGPLTGLAGRVLDRQRHVTLPAERRHQLLRFMRDLVLVSIAAQLMTTPLVVGTFGRLSLVAPLTNLLIVPVQGVLLASGGLAALAGMVWLPLGKVLAAAPFACVAWTLEIVQWTARFPLASIALGPFQAWQVWSLYVGAAGAWLAVRWWRSHELASGGQRRLALPPALASRRAALLWGAVLFLATTPWWVRLYLPDGRLHLYVLDVGQGDALLVVTPDGKQVLIDGGPDPVALLAELGQRIPPWDRTIELVILSHADADHIGGLPELLARYEVAQVMDSGYGRETAVYEAWQAALQAEEVEPAVAMPGERWSLGRGAVLEVLAPTGVPFETPNENSVVVRLRYGQFCALLAGDIGAAAEARLLSSGALGECQVLKVPHHGSQTSSSQRFLDALRPRYALLSVGADNLFGHPSAEVTARYETMGTQLFRTDEQGTIHLMTDGRSLWAKAER